MSIPTAHDKTCPCITKGPTISDLLISYLPLSVSLSFESSPKLDVPPITAGLSTPGRYGGGGGSNADDPPNRVCSTCLPIDPSPCIIFDCVCLSFDTSSNLRDFDGPEPCKKFCFLFNGVPSLESRESDRPLTKSSFPRLGDIESRESRLLSLINGRRLSSSES